MLKYSYHNWVRGTLMRLNNALVAGLNRFIRLPRLIVFFPNTDFTHFTSNHANTERNIGWLFGQMILSIGEHKKDLRNRAAHKDTAPKFLLFKPLPKQEPVDSLGDFRNKCRICNRSVENVVHRYDNVFITNVDEIKLDEPKLFDETGGQLNKRGVRTPWRGINEAVERLDSGCMKPFKYVYQDLMNQRVWEASGGHDNYSNNYRKKRY